MSKPAILEHNKEIDFHQLVGTLIDNRWLISSVTAAFTAISVCYALVATPIYQSDVLIQVEHRLPTGGAGASQLQSLLAAPNSEAVTEIALLTSRTVVGKAVDDLRLDVSISPRRFPLVGDLIARRFVPTASQPVAQPWLGLSRYGWGGETLKIARFDVPDAMLGAPFTLIAGSNRSYQLKDSDGNVVLHSMVGEVAQAHGASLLVSDLAANPGTIFDLRRTPTLSVVKSLQNDLIATEQGKDSGIIDLTYQHQDAALANAILRDVSETYVRQNVEHSAAEAANSLQFVRDQLPRIKADLDRAQGTLKRYQAGVGSVDLGIETRSLLEQAVAAEAGLQQVRLQQADASSKFQPGHPALRALADQAAQFEAKKHALQAQIAALPDTQQQLLQLTRDVEVSTQTYTAMLAQAQQLDVARAGTTGSVRIVDVAAVDTTQPVKPKRLIIVAIGLVAGLVAAALAVTIRQMMNRGIEDPSAIEAIGLPVYASVPLSAQVRDPREMSRLEGKSGAGRPHLLAIESPTDLASEALRSLRTSLHFALLEARNNVLMIGGLSPAVGKTFIAANLAAVVAQSGQRVLVIDADMRRGVAHAALGVSAEHGLSDVVSGRKDAASVIHKGIGHPHLDFMPRGKVPSNPAELLLHSNFATLIAKMSAQYDLVIIDTPPVLAVADASIIGRYAGTCLLVVRFGLSQLREVALAQRRLSQSNVQVKGVIFNAIERRTHGYLSWGQYAYDSEE